MSERVPVGVLISGSGTNLQALIDAAMDPDFPAEIKVVISNRPHARGLERARAADIPAVVVPHRAYPTRESFEAELLQVLRSFEVQWVALAGFMRLLTATFLAAYDGRVLNIHPALLPAFPGTHAQSQAFEYGVRIAGVTLHFVNEGTDTGPIIAQGAIPVLSSDTEETLAARLLRIEHRLYPKVLRWAAEGRLHREGRKVRVELAEGESTWFWGG